MATTDLLNAAESWEKVYKAFEVINFTAYDYDSVKQSLLDYLKFTYPENFNDYVESSLMVALIELFAYISEQLAYRVDMSTHEVMPTASRKQSILRLAKLVSYTATRNIPLRGLVKITSISLSEDTRDSQGNSLANRVVKWNDVNNPLWREQFFLLVNKILTQPFGDPFKAFQLDDTVFEQYEAQNVLETTTSGRSSFKNGTLKFKVDVNGQSLPFELVPADIDADGVFERSPNPNAYFNLLYADDGFGDSSDTTGFMMYAKQGTLTKLPYGFDVALPNRVLDLTVNNINDLDVWVQQVDDSGTILTEWTQVPTANGTNLVFNSIEETTKYEVETLENDQVRLIFGDGDFAQIPTGLFTIWVRASAGIAQTVQKSQVVDMSTTFLYTSKLGKQESCTLTFSLASALENAAASEDIEHIRTAAPSVYYTQDRMVNGRDYNSYFLKDPSILRVKSVNRTFAGQTKYLPWNDPTGSYQNVKLFGDDLALYYDAAGAVTISQVSARRFIDDVLEPLLSSPGLESILSYAFYTSADTELKAAYTVPRTTFIEDEGQTYASVPIMEKTLLQGALDRHWYGEPDSIVQLDINLTDVSSLPKSPFAIVNDDADQRIYDPNLRMVTKNTLTGLYSLVPTANNSSGIQELAFRQRRFGIRFNPVRPFESALQLNSFTTDPQLIPTSSALVPSDVTQANGREEIFTVTITDTVGNFSVYSSIDGYRASGRVGTAYIAAANISFLIGFPPFADTTLYPGDSYVITVTNVSGVFTPTFTKHNLTGRFELIDEITLTSGAEALAYNVNDPIASWVIIVERVDGSDGNVAYWKLTARDFGLTVESPTTKFWYNSDSVLVDAETKKRVRDTVKLLKSNLTIDGAPVGTDQAFSVLGPVTYPDGEVNVHALKITPIDTKTTFYSGTGVPNNPIEFLNFIGTDSYVYFSRNLTNGRLSVIEPSSYLESLSYDDSGVSGSYARKKGRNGLDFMWQHFTPYGNLIDPSRENIIDVYALTRGYYTDMISYLNGNLAAPPTEPTSLELRNSYRTLIQSKMISDTVVMHSGKVKLLFGDLAVPELRARFKVVLKPTAKLTAEQVKSKVLGEITSYFAIENWDFGQEFWAQNLCAVIQKALSTEVSSVVLVPIFPTNYFGDLFYLRSAPNEIFLSCATLANVEIVSGLDRVTLKQKS